MDARRCCICCELTCFQIDVKVSLGVLQMFEPPCYDVSDSETLLEDRCSGYVFLFWLVVWESYRSFLDTRQMYREFVSFDCGLQVLVHGDLMTAVADEWHDCQFV